MNRFDLGEFCSIYIYIEGDFLNANRESEECFDLDEFGLRRG